MRTPIQFEPGTIKYFPPQEVPVRLARLLSAASRALGYLEATMPEKTVVKELAAEIDTCIAFYNQPDIVAVTAEDSGADNS